MKPFKWLFEALAFLPRPWQYAVTNGLIGLIIVVLACVVDVAFPGNGDISVPKMLAAIVVVVSGLPLGLLLGEQHFLVAAPFNLMLWGWIVGFVKSRKRSDE